MATLGQFLGVGIVLNPYPQIAELRAQAPVHQIDMRRHLGAPADPAVEDLDKFAVFGWSEVREAFETPTVFSSTVLERTTGKMFGRFTGVMDAPEHTRWRPFFMRAFLPNVVAQWGERYVDPILGGLIDRFVIAARSIWSMNSRCTSPFCSFAGSWVFCLRTRRPTSK